MPGLAHHGPQQRVRLLDERGDVGVDVLSERCRVIGLREPLDEFLKENNSKKGSSRQPMRGGARPWFRFSQVGKNSGLWPQATKRYLQISGNVSSRHVFLTIATIAFVVPCRTGDPRQVGRSIL